MNRPVKIDVQLALDLVFDPHPDARGNVAVAAIVTTERAISLVINAN